MIWPNVDLLPRHPSPIYQMLIDGVIISQYNSTFFSPPGLVELPGSTGAIKNNYDQGKIFFHFHF